MSALLAIAQQQPATLWLGAGALLIAVAATTGWRGAAWSAAAGPLASLVALAAPRALPVQAAVFALAAVALAALALRRDLRARSRRGAVASPEPEGAGTAADALLLGRVVRAAGAFDGEVGQVAVDGTVRAAVLGDPGPSPAADARLRVVRVGGSALAVRPLDV